MNKKIIIWFAIACVLSFIAFIVILLLGSNNAKFDEYELEVEEGGLEFAPATNEKHFTNDAKAKEEINSYQLDLFYITLSDDALDWDTCEFVSYDPLTKCISILDNGVPRDIEFDEDEQLYYIIFKYY